MKKRIISLFLCVLMVVSLLPASVWAADEGGQPAENTTESTPAPEGEGEATPAPVEEATPTPEPTEEPTPVPPVLTALPPVTGAEPEEPTPEPSPTSGKLSGEYPWGKEAFEAAYSSDPLYSYEDYKAERSNVAWSFDAESGTMTFSQINEESGHTVLGGKFPDEFAAFEILSVIIGAGISEVEMECVAAVDYFDSVKNIYVSADNDSRLDSKNGVLYYEHDQSYGCYTLVWWPAAKTCSSDSFFSSCDRIGSYAFAHNKKTVCINLPDRVYYLCSYAFKGYTGGVVLPDTFYTATDDYSTLEPYALARGEGEFMGLGLSGYWDDEMHGFGTPRTDQDLIACGLVTNETYGIYMMPGASQSDHIAATPLYPCNQGVGKTEYDDGNKDYVFVLGKYYSLKSNEVTVTFINTDGDNPNCYGEGHNWVTTNGGVVNYLPEADSDDWYVENPVCSDHGKKYLAWYTKLGDEWDTMVTNRTIFTEDTTVYSRWADVQLTNSYPDFVYGELTGTVLTIFGHGVIAAAYDSDADEYGLPESIRDVVTSVVIEDGITELGAFLFRLCCKLTSVSLPDTLTTIDGNLFFVEVDDPAFSLESIVIPDSVTTIGSNAFSGLKSLREVHMSRNLKTIGNSIFSGCSSLTSLEIYSGTLSVGENTGTLSKSFVKYLLLHDGVVVPDKSAIRTSSLRYIGLAGTWSQKEFDACAEALHQVAQRYYDWYEGTVITPNIVIGWLPDAVYTNVTDFEVSYLDDSREPAGGKVTVVQFYPENEYGEQLDFGGKKYSLLDGSQKDEGTDGFVWSVVGGGTVLTISPSKEGESYIMPDYTDPDVSDAITPPWNKYKDKITKVIVKKGIQNIGDYTFYRYPSLSSVILPDGLTEIGDYAFNGSYNIEVMYLPETVTTVGNKAFGGTYPYDPEDAERYYNSKLSFLTVTPSMIYKGEDYSLLDLDDLYYFNFGMVGDWSEVTSDNHPFLSFANAHDISWTQIYYISGATPLALENPESNFSSLKTLGPITAEDATRIKAYSYEDEFYAFPLYLLRNTWYSLISGRIWEPSLKWEYDSATSRITLTAGYGISQWDSEEDDEWSYNFGFDLDIPYRPTTLCIGKGITDYYVDDSWWDSEGYGYYEYDEGHTFDCVERFEVDGNDAFSVIDGMLFDKDEKLIRGPYASADGTVTVPAGTETIGPDAFAYSDFEKLVLPASLTTLESNALSHLSCTVEFPEDTGITTIKSYALYESKTNLCKLPKSLDNVGQAGFAYTGNTSYMVPATFKRACDEFSPGWVCEAVTDHCITSVGLYGDWTSSELSGVSEVIECFFNERSSDPDPTFYWMPDAEYDPDFDTDGDVIQLYNCDQNRDHTAKYGEDNNGYDVKICGTWYTTAVPGKSGPVVIDAPADGSSITATYDSGKNTSGVSIPEGTPVTLTATDIKTGYKVKAWTVTKTGNAETVVPCTTNADGTGTFIMPGYEKVGDQEVGVTVSVEYELEKYVVTVTSRFTGTNQTVAYVSGGGEYTIEDTVELSASPVKGYEFWGWTTEYDTGVDYTNTEKESLDVSKYTVNADVTLYAVYTYNGGEYFHVSVSCPGKFNVTYGDKAYKQYASYANDLPSGNLAVEYTGNENFLYWVNDSGNIMTTGKNFSTLLTSDQTLTAIIAPEDSDVTTIAFKNAYDKGQLLQTGLYSVDGDKLSPTLEYPAAPATYGKDFANWAVRVNGEDVNATEDVLVGMMTGENAPSSITVYPVYDSVNKYTYKVQYKCGNLTVKSGESLEDVASGSSMYANIEDQYTTVYKGDDVYYFSHWALNYGKNNETVVSTNKRAVVVVTEDTTLTAVYVTRQSEKMNQETTFVFQPLTSVPEGSRYKITCSAIFSLSPESVYTVFPDAENLYTAADIVHNGFLYSTKKTAALTLGNTGIYKTEWSTSSKLEFSHSLSVYVGKPTSNVYFRAFIEMADGTVFYSAPMSTDADVTYSIYGSYNSINPSIG